MSVDDDDDDDDIDEQSNDLPCIEENGAESSEDGDNDNDGDDDDDSQQTFLVFCDRHGKHSPQNVFFHVGSSSSVSGTVRTWWLIKMRQNYLKNFLKSVKFSSPKILT